MAIDTTGTGGIPNHLLNQTKTASDKSTEASDRFLKLLVTQMQNQDPLNPMDNAQVTSQMAQINTVTGIEKLNTTVAGLNSGFAQMQLTQSVGLVGHSVLLEGNKLGISSDGVANGGFELSSKATTVNVDIIGPSGKVLDTVEMGAQGAGQHGFEWKVPEGMSSAGLTFKVTAKSGSAALTPTHLMTDLVDAVSSKDGVLNLQLRNSGDTAYSKVRALS